MGTVLLNGGESPLLRCQELNQFKELVLMDEQP